MNRTITFLLFGYYPSDPRVRRQAEALAGAGWQVDVLCTSKDGIPKSWELNGVAIQEVALAKTRGSILQYLSQYMRVTLAFRHELARRDWTPSVVQVATLPDFLVAAATPLRARGAKVVLDFHEIMPEFFSSKYGGFMGRLARKLLELVERWSAARADTLLTVNDSIAGKFAERLGVRPIVVYNSPDDRLFGPPRVCRVKSDQGPLTFGYHGTITSIYGLDILLEACAQLRQKEDRVRVLVFGDGPDLPRLQVLAKELCLQDTVHFAGRIPLDQMPKRLEEVDIGVVPTRKDEFLDLSLGTKLLEYVHLGKPVVASDLEAVRRVFPPPDSLLYFRGNDSKSLAAGMETALEMDSQEWCKRVVTAQRQYEHIAWPRMRDRYIAVLESLVEGK